MGLMGSKHFGQPQLLILDTPRSIFWTHAPVERPLSERVDLEPPSDTDGTTTKHILDTPGAYFGHMFRWSALSPRGWIWNPVRHGRHYNKTHFGHPLSVFWTHASVEHPLSERVDLEPPSETDGTTTKHILDTL